MKTELLSPRNSEVIFIDLQHRMTFVVANIDTMVHGAAASRAGAAGQRP